MGVSFSLSSSAPLKRYFALYISLQTAVTKEQMKPSSSPLLPSLAVSFTSELKVEWQRRTDGRRGCDAVAALCGDPFRS